MLLDSRYISCFRSTPDSDKNERIISQTRAPYGVAKKGLPSIWEGQVPNAPEERHPHVDIPVHTLPKLEEPQRLRLEQLHSRKRGVTGGWKRITGQKWTFLRGNQHASCNKTGEDFREESNVEGAPQGPTNLRSVELKGGAILSKSRVLPHSH